MHFSCTWVGTLPNIGWVERSPDKRHLVVYWLMTSSKSAGSVHLQPKKPKMSMVALKRIMSSRWYEVQLAKVKLELNLATVIKDNKALFHKYISDKRRAK